MPILANLLISLFGVLGTFLTKYVTKKPPFGSRLLPPSPLPSRSSPQLHTPPLAASMQPSRRKLKRFSHGSSHHSREDYIENGPLFRFPPMVQPVIGGALSDTTTASNNQRTALQNVLLTGDMYPCTPKLIAPGDAFELTAKWAAAVAVSTAGTIEGRLYGFLADLR